MAAQNESITSKKRSDALAPPPKQVIEDALGIQNATVEWLAGDGSDRCYYRIKAPELPAPLVLMQLSELDAAALRDDGYDWLKIATLFGSHGISVPKPVKTLPEYAALIIEDYGDVMLEGVIFDASKTQKMDTIQEYYQRCFAIICQMLAIPPNGNSPWEKRQFDKEKYLWELNFFEREFLAPVAGVRFDKKQRLAFEKDIEALAEFLASRSKYFVHRDFHSRNIMVQGDKLAIIDFQDARYGARSYDLVSLIFDNYLPFDYEFRLALLDDGIQHLCQGAGPDAEQTLREELGPVILQRQLKAIGTYGFLTNAKKRGDYLKYVPAALKSLTPDLIFDRRWPFLSKTLIEMLQKFEQS